jgi:hypothetical protein
VGAAAARGGERVPAFGAARGNNVARGMLLVLTCTANVFDKMIIAGAGSITARGLGGAQLRTHWPPLPRRHARKRRG